MNENELIERYELIARCRHAIGGKVNESGEILIFCELSDRLENVILGECIGNCEFQMLDFCGGKING